MPVPAACTARRAIRSLCGFPTPPPPRPPDKLAAGASPAQRPGPNCTSPARSANDPNDTASQRRPVFVVETSDSVAPKGDSMQHKSVPLLIKSADDDSGTFTGLASVFDNLDHDGDIVRRGAFSKSLGSGTRRYR